jgi:flagellar biosynthesis protein FlhF
MKIKKYEAKTMNDAVKMIKSDFGSEAVILHSRTINKGGLMGLFGQEMVEVMAGIDVNIIEKKPIEKKIETQKEIFMSEAKKNMNNVASANNSKHNAIENKKIILSSENNDFRIEEKVTTLTREIDNIKETLDIIYSKVVNSPHPMISPKLINYYKKLEEKGICEDIIINILQSLENEISEKDYENKGIVNDFLRTKISTMLGSENPINLDNMDSKKIIAFVGPTGVGKTTTLAKMAATFSLIKKKKVALITIDTFRVAAIEQLRNYSDIIGIPMEVVFNMDDFTQALRKFSKMDLILIDTAGRSPNNSSQIMDLKKFLRNSFVETYLVLSVTAKTKDLYNTIALYSPIFDDKVIFTKVDETTTRGVILDIVYKYKKKLTYFTNGQNVPDDFEQASISNVVDLILNS